MMKRDDINTILQLCEELELTLARLYSFFAELYSQDRDIAAVWKKTEREEINHASQFRLAMRIPETIEDFTIDIPLVEQHLWIARTALDDATENPPDIESALNLAIRLEDTFTQFHMNTAATMKDASFSSLFTSMMDADMGHSATMKDALSRFKIAGRA